VLKLANYLCVSDYFATFSINLIHCLIASLTETWERAHLQEAFSRVFLRSEDLQRLSASVRAIDITVFADSVKYYILQLNKIYLR